jgi:hypothetical protein
VSGSSGGGGGGGGGGSSSTGFAAGFFLRAQACVFLFCYCFVYSRKCILHFFLTSLLSLSFLPFCLSNSAVEQWVETMRTPPVLDHVRGVANSCAMRAQRMEQGYEDSLLSLFALN